MIVRHLAVLIFAVLTLPVSAAETACSMNDQHWLSNELPSLTSWRAIRRSFQRYVPQCDDGFIAGGYSEAIVVMLSHRWSSLHELATVANRNPQFGKFVLQHIDASADLDDLKRIKAQAANQCPPKHQTLCVSIHTAAVEAIKAI
jgi:hypothetical protein